MIKTLELKFFRKHEDLLVNFTNGLNVVRGPNEIGKTTLTEGILYALYGATSLVDTLAEVVTWGHKENELKTKLVISVGGRDYTFVRSKAGAECDGPDGKVTGQKEVTAFAASLLGADAKTAGALMLASQSGLRGALDDGPTAVSSLMSKLADFDMVDRLLESAAQTLSLGTTAPILGKLADAEAAVLDTQSKQIDPATLDALNGQVVEATAKHGAAVAASTILEEKVAKADEDRDKAVLNNLSHSNAMRTVVDNQSKLDTEKSNLDRAVVESKTRPTPASVEAARSAVTAAKNHAAILADYKLFATLGDYPVVSWDSDQDSFDAALADAVKRRDDAMRAVDASMAEEKALKLTLISGDGVCPTCKRPADNHDHVLDHNTQVAEALARLGAARDALRNEHAGAAAEVAEFGKVSASAKRRQGVIDRINRDRLVLDHSVYPCRVEWQGTAPEPESQLVRLKAALDSLEEADRQASQAEGRATAHRAQIEYLQNALTFSKDVASRIAVMPVEPLDEAYNAAFREYQEQAVKAADLRRLCENITEERNRVSHIVETQAEQLRVCVARVTELQADIKTLEFNNELVKKLKSMKPLITDFLWSNVLAAVSNYFSTLRGEQSIVTKDASGFKVNGRGGSLSGSTLDVLALSIRVALSKTFVPHSDFMVLDEPAHGADEVRTGNILGFLAGCGLNQVILASHDELSEAVADNVIVLGA